MCVCACVREDTLHAQVTLWLSLSFANDKRQDIVRGLTGANWYHADQCAAARWSITLKQASEQNELNKEQKVRVLKETLER